MSSQDVMAVREITWVVFSLAQGRLFWGSTSSLQIYKRMLQRGRNKFYFVQEEMVVRKNWTLKGKKKPTQQFSDNSCSEVLEQTVTSVAGGL